MPFSSFPFHGIVLSNWIVRLLGLLRPRFRPSRFRCCWLRKVQGRRITTLREIIRYRVADLPVCVSEKNPRDLAILVKNQKCRETIIEVSNFHLFELKNLDTLRIFLFQVSKSCISFFILPNSWLVKFSRGGGTLVNLLFEVSTDHITIYNFRYCLARVPIYLGIKGKIYSRACICANAKSKESRGNFQPDSASYCFPVTNILFCYFPSFSCVDFADR